MGEPVVSDVLVVDDDLDVRETLVEAIESFGYRVAQAANGADALKYLKTSHARLVLLDLMMPEMDGWQFRFAQQRVEELAKIPVVLLSAATGLAHAAAMMKPDDCLAKPLDLSKLREVVDRYCAV